jgi:hypothetical protein
VEWVGLVMAPDETTAAMWCEILQNEGVSAVPKLAGAGNYVGIVFGPIVPNECWVMVHEDDVDRAAAILGPMIEGKRRHRRRPE